MQAFKKKKSSKQKLFGLAPKRLSVGCEKKKKKNKMP